MTSRISELASRIAENTEKIHRDLQLNSSPFPSFDADGPVTLELRSPNAQNAHRAAINDCIELLDLLQGPFSSILPVSLTIAALKLNATSLQIIYRYNLPAKVPVGGEISIQELSKECQIYEPDLRRILRFSIAFHRIFQEPRKGFVAHSAASRKLAEDPVIFEGMGLMFNDFYPSFARTVEALEHFRSQEPNETGFSLSHNTDQTVFDYLASRPADAKRFALAMKSFTANISGNSPSFLVGGYPWAALGSAHVVDVGGSEGQTSVALAQAFPSLEFTVQDRPEVICDAVDKVPPEVRSRVRFLEHDFFQTQTVVGADVYLFRWIFHDWPDRYVIRILRQLIPALKPGARVLVNDSLNPEPNVLPLALERTIRSVDMIMLSLHNSRERDQDEWVQLFKDADPRFGEISIRVPEGSALAIIEAVWKG